MKTVEEKASKFLKLSADCRLEKCLLRRIELTEKLTFLTELGSRLLKYCFMCYNDYVIQEIENCVRILIQDLHHKLKTKTDYEFDKSYLEYSIQQRRRCNFEFIITNLLDYTTEQFADIIESQINQANNLASTWVKANKSLPGKEPGRVDLECLFKGIYDKRSLRVYRDVILDLGFYLVRFLSRYDCQTSLYVFQRLIYPALHLIRQHMKPQIACDLQMLTIVQFTDVFWKARVNYGAEKLLELLILVYVPLYNGVLSPKMEIFNYIVDTIQTRLDDVSGETEFEAKVPAQYRLSPKLLWSHLLRLSRNIQQTMESLGERHMKTFAFVMTKKIEKCEVRKQVKKIIREQGSKCLPLTDLEYCREMVLYYRVTKEIIGAAKLLYEYWGSLPPTEPRSYNNVQETFSVMNLTRTIKYMTLLLESLLPLKNKELWTRREDIMRKKTELVVEDLKTILDWKIRRKGKSRDKNAPICPENPCSCINQCFELGIDQEVDTIYGSRESFLNCNECRDRPLKKFSGCQRNGKCIPIKEKRCPNLR